MKKRAAVLLCGILAAGLLSACQGGSEPEKTVSGVSGSSQTEGEAQGESSAEEGSGGYKIAFTCILRSRADSEAFQSGRYAEHNGRPKTLKKVA